MKMQGLEKNLEQRLIAYQQTKNNLTEQQKFNQKQKKDFTQQLAEQKEFYEKKIQEREKENTELTSENQSMKKRIEQFE